MFFFKAIFGNLLTSFNAIITPVGSEESEINSEIFSSYSSNLLQMFSFEIF